MDTYDSQDIEIPFQNAYRGPAGEYSDAYKAIVDQYRNELASAAELRQEQKQQREIQQYIDSGLRPPSMMRQAVQRMPQPRYLKSGNDWYQVGADGRPSMVVDAPEIRRPSAIIPPNMLDTVDIPKGYNAVPYGLEGFKIERAPAQSFEDKLASLMGGTNAPALTPPPLVQPRTATTTAPPAPTPRFYAGPANDLDAPLQTTQDAFKSAEEVRAAFKAGKLTKENASKILREQFKMR